MLVHHRVTPSIKFASTHLYTWVERGTVGVKWTVRSGVELTNHEATAPPLTKGGRKETRNISAISTTHSYRCLEVSW